MRSSVTSDLAIPLPVLTDRSDWPSQVFAPGPQPLRFDVSGDDALTGTPVRVRLIDVTQGRRLAADDEGRHVSDDPLAWVEGSWDAATGA